MKIIKILLSVCSIAYFAGICVARLGLLRHPKLCWLADLIYMSPLWVFLLPAVALAVISLMAGLKVPAVLNVISCGAIVFFLMGYNIPFGVIGQKKSDQAALLRIASCNLGIRVDRQSLARFISHTRPDVIAFQEAYPNNQKAIKSILSRDGWHLAFQGNLGIASRLKVMDSETIKRDIVGGWGELAVRYLLEGPKGSINLFNVHLRTPGPGIEAVIDGPAGFAKMRKVAGLQEKESRIISAWVAPYKNVVIAGDFNMPQSNPMYRKYWGGLTNAFSRAGKGFGYTRFTRWHGVRIDHILSDDKWKAVHSEVGPDIGSDHRPMIADLEYTGRAPEAGQAAVAPRKKQPAEGTLAYEDFGVSLGSFKTNGTALMTIDSETTWQRNNSLRVDARDGAKTVSIGMPLDTWRISAYPLISFAYKVPSGTFLGLCVKTTYDDLVVIAKTSPDQLIGDGMWHEARIDVAQTMRAILPNVKMLKGVEFFSGSGDGAETVFWLSQFRIEAESKP